MRRGDLGPLRGERVDHRLEPGERRADGKIGCLGDVLVRDAHGERLRLQPRAVADRARLLGFVARELLAHPGAVGFLLAAPEVADDALERLRHAVGAHAVLVGEGDVLLAGAVQDRVAHALGQFGPGRARRHLEVPREALQGLVVVRRLRPGPGRDRAIRQRHALVRHDEVRIEERIRGRGRRRPGRRRAGC